MEMQEIGEVPLCSFCDTKKQWPAWLWRLAGWLQWMTGSDRQPEKRSHTVARAKEVVKKLEKEEKDCILVVHPVFLRTMLGVLRRQGYCITASRMFGAMPLDRFRAAKWSEHCGGCQHNCLLTNPNCQIGREKALKRKANRG